MGHRYKIYNPSSKVGTICPNCQIINLRQHMNFSERIITATPKPKKNNDLHPAIFSGHEEETRVLIGQQARAKFPLGEGPFENRPNSAAVLIK